MNKKSPFILIILLLFWGTLSFAQNEHNIYICITQSDNPEVQQIIIVRDTSAVGFIFPFDAEIMIYSATTVDAGLYTINPDANTGGYTAVENLATITTGQHLPTETRCQTSMTNLEIDTETLTKSISIPVSFDHALIMTLDIEAVDLANPDILGVIMMSFQGNTPFDLQILQISSTDPRVDLHFPFLLPSTPFVMVANKSFSYIISLIEDGEEIFDSRQNSAARRFLISQLYSIRDINLFNLLESKQARIYPDHGATNDYLGGYIRIEFGSGRAERQTSFTSGDKVVPIEEAIEVQISPPEIERREERLGILQFDNVFLVSRIDENGNLFLQDNNSVEVFVPAWLVEVQN